eukprot:gene14000-15458_t
MPQGQRKKTSSNKDKALSGVATKSKKIDKKKQVKAKPLKKGARYIAPKKKEIARNHEIKKMLQKEYSKSLEEEMMDKAGASNLKVEHERNTVKIGGEGIDLQKLLDGEATELIVEENKDLENDFENTYFDNEEVLKNLNFDCNYGDESDGDSEMTPFERMAVKMEDISPAKDRGVLKMFIKHGTGDVIPDGSFVRVHYNGYLEFSEEPFDSSRLRGFEYKLTLGQGEVLPGWEIAIKSMKKGEFSRFLISHQYAYGKMGCPPRIPPEASVLLEIEVMGVVERTAADQFENFSQKQKNESTFENLLKAVDSHREIGNDAFKKKQFIPALKSYKKAIGYLENCRLANEQEETDMFNMCLKLYLNSSLCCLKMNEYGKAAMYARKALRVDRQNVKAHFRLGRALLNMGEFVDARVSLLQAQRLSPGNKEVSEEIKTLGEKVKKFNEVNRSIYGKMFGESDEKRASPVQENLGEEESKGLIEYVVKKLVDFNNNADETELPLPLCLKKNEIDKISSLAPDYNCSIAEDKGTKILPFVYRSTYAGMLHDTERNANYHRAIVNAIEKFKKEGEKSKVLDIGTGTGILAMMAAKCDASSVVACEVFQPMAAIARDVIKSNNLSDKIKVIAKQSTDVQVGNGSDEMEERANILVTEIFDTELIGEGVLPTLRDAHQRLLNADAVTIPSSGTVHLCLAECPSLWKMQKLGNVKLQDGRSLKQTQSMKNCLGTVAAYEVHVDQVDDMRMLTEPIDALRIPFNKSVELNKHENGSYNSYHLRAEIKQPGTIHCIVLWWSIQLDEKQDISLSMVPKICSSKDDVKWREHWMQAVYFVPGEINATIGQSIDINMFHDDYSFWFDVPLPTSPPADDVKKMPLCSCGLHTSWSRERFLMNNDFSIFESFNTSFRNIGVSKSCLIVGDVSLLPIFAASYFEKVFYVECTSGSKNFIKKLVSLNHLTEKIDIINISELKDESISQLPNIHEINVICGEPFFASSLLPWQHFTFWYRISDVLTTIHPKPKILPAKAVLKIAAVEFKELWKVRSPVRQVEGFAMHDFDATIKLALSPTNRDDNGLLSEAEPFPVWEYEHEILSDITQVSSFDFTNPVPDETMVFDGAIRKLRSGTCNAIVSWVDFYLDEDSEWTTGYQTSERRWVKHSKQGVCFLENHCPTSSKSSLKYHIVFQPATCEMLFNFIPIQSAEER